MDGRPRGTTVSRHSIRSSTHWNMPASMPGTARSSGPTANGYRSSSRWSASTLSIRACLATCSKLTCWADSKTVRQNPAPNTNSRNSTGSSSRGSMILSARHQPPGSSRELGTLEVVALALIPEAIGFSVVAGVDPKVGLYASVVIACVIAFTGGRRAMISAATASTAVLMTGLVHDHGLQYLLAATILMGVFQVLAGLLKLGRLMRFV